jgi:hypothetical protein
MAEEFIALRVAQRQQFALNPGEVMRIYKRYLTQ